MGLRLGSEKAAREFAAKYGIDPAELGLHPAVIEPAAPTTSASAQPRPRRQHTQGPPQFNAGRVMWTCIIAFAVIYVLLQLAIATIPGNGWVDKKSERLVQPAELDAGASYRLHWGV